MNHNLPDIVGKKRAEVQQQRQKLLSLPPEKALDFILEAPQPAALVHALAEQDLYFLVQDIGPADALPLIALASDKQWEFFLDNDIWHHDRLDFVRVTNWLELFLQANPKRLVRWCLEEKTELMELYFYKSIRVKIREHDQDPSTLGDGFVTCDDVLYYRFLETPGALQDDKVREYIESRQRVVTELLDRLADYDHRKYQAVLLESAALVPAECEEERYRLRNVRLAEKGFLPFDEAQSIYAAVSTPQLKSQAPKVLVTPQTAGGRSFLPRVEFPARLLTENNFFTQALTVLDPGDVLMQIESEFAALCNQIIAADGQPVKGREQLREVVRKACGYLSLGLKRLADNPKTPSPRQAAAQLRRWPLIRIFQHGYGLALALKWQAQKWYRQSWAQKKNLALSFWDEAWMGVLGGLLIKRPLFFDNYESGQAYRQFADLSDIQKTQTALEAIMATDAFFASMDIDIPEIDEPWRVNYKNTLLTLWARAFLNLEAVLAPITTEQFKLFFKALRPGLAPSEIGLDMQKALLDWLARKSGLTNLSISQDLGQVLSDLFVELKEHYGAVAPADIDPRFVTHFWLTKN